MKILAKKPTIDYFEQMLETSRPVDKKVGRRSGKSDSREQEVDNSLSEIYQDDRGQTIDVRRFAVRHRHWWMRGLLIVVYGLVLTTSGWLAYNYYTSYRAKNDLLIINIETDKNLISGQEFTYKINYQNNGSVALSDVEVTADWPESFIFAQAEPAPVRADNVWQIADVPAKSSGQIIVHGRLINKIGENNQLSLSASFRPVNLSSTFVISSQYNAVLSDSSLAVGLSAPDTLAIGRDNELVINYQAKENNNLDNLQLIVGDIDWADINLIDSQDKVLERQTDQAWTLPVPTDQAANFKLIIVPKADLTGLKNLPLRLETKVGEHSYLVDSRDFDFQLINSKLNLLLKVNGSNADSGVAAGQTLEYQIDYTNQGDSNLKDVNLAVSLQGAWLDWSSLKDAEQGQINGQTITWSKKELPDLALLKPGSSGTIKFSIKLKDWDKGDKSDSGQVVSYAYYLLGADTAKAPGDNQRSNTITDQLNSDLSFRETIMYFNEDNIAVGSGPLPLVVGETTNFKVYWHLNNTLHDLRDISVTVELPDYVNWAGKNYTANGQIAYDQDSRQVVWRLDRLPANSDDLVGEFSIGVTPRSDQQNQIIILMPGSKVVATDNATQSRLEISSQAKTSRLEDDKIAQTTGLVK